MSKPVTIIMIEDDEGHARLIERDDVDATLLDPLNAGFAVIAMLDAKALPRQAARHQPRKTCVVVDIQQRWRRGRCHVDACGT